MPQEERFSPRERHQGGIAGRFRRSTWSLLTIVAVIGGLVGTATVVRARAGEKDTLREAQNALGVAPGTVEAVLGSPKSLLAGQPAGPTEFPLNKKLRDELTKTMRDLNLFWRAPMARTLRAEAVLVNARTVTLMGLIAAHRVRDANVLNERYIQPAADKLKAAIITADGRLGREIKAADATAWRATLGVIGAAGVLLVLLIVGMATARRRRLRAEVEQDVLRDSERRLRALVQHGSDMITVVKPDTTVIYQAGAVGLMLGCAPGELEGARLTAWLDPDDVAALMELCATPATASAELRLRHRDGNQRTCEVHATNLRQDPAWEGIVLNIWDVSERKELEERLRHQAFHDTLTGLPNRALVLDRAEQMLARARRQQIPVAALYVDVDGFKHVNDTFGHAAGDELLQTVAARLMTVVREGDTAARLGGDEFIVLLEGSTLDAGPELVAERLLEVLREPYEMSGKLGRQLTITASIGIAVGAHTDADELLRDADLAMYDAKVSGRNRYKLFASSMQSSSQDRLTLEMDLGEALERQQFFLLYQPTFDLRSESVTGVEALIRWRHPTRGIISPREFIPIAEDSGLIVPIGRWVLAQACRQASIWHDRGHRIGMSVNVSGRQLDEDDLIEDVRQALQDSGLDPAVLTLEVTETTLMRDPVAAADRLHQLKQLGVRIAIDDFGTGYSSLAYLRQFPADALKIDRSFIGGIATSKASAALIHTLVQLGKTLDIETLAEGIEDQAQLQTLQRESCDQGQGFLFSRPIDVDTVEQFLNAAKPTAPVAGK
jgi:diguanylate cyclase (GGDEF)-like protein/PAS domain S-box-containing protein